MAVVAGLEGHGNRASSHRHPTAQGLLAKVVVTVLFPVLPVSPAVSPAVSISATVLAPVVVSSTVLAAVIVSSTVVSVSPVVASVASVGVPAVPPVAPPVASSGGVHGMPLGVDGAGGKTQKDKGNADGLSRFQSQLHRVLKGNAHAREHKGNKESIGLEERKQWKQWKQCGSVAV